MWNRQDKVKSQNTTSSTTPKLDIHSNLSSWSILQELQHSTDHNISKGVEKKREFPIWVMKFSKDGRFLASGGHDGIVKIWCLKEDPIFDNIQFHDIDFGKLKRPNTTNSFNHQRSFTTEEPMTLKNAPSSSSFPNPFVNTKKTRDFIHIFHPTPLRIYRGHKLPITDIAWSPTHEFILSSSIDGTVKLWNILSQECLVTFDHGDVVTCVKFNPNDSKLFISGCYDGRIRIWSLLAKKLMIWKEVSKNPVTAVCITNDGSVAIVGTLMGECCFYELSNLKYDTQISFSSQLKVMRSGTKSKLILKITSIESIPSSEREEERILVASSDSKIRVINLKDKSLFRTFRGHISVSSFLRCDISYTGQTIVSASEDKYVYFWNIKRDMEDTAVNPSASMRIDSIKGLDRFSVDDFVVSCILAPLGFSSLKRQYQKQFELDSLEDETLFLVTGDVHGKIQLYKNEPSASSASSTFRSTVIKDPIPSIMGRESSDVASLFVPPTLSRNPSEKPASIKSVEKPSLLLNKSQMKVPDISVSFYSEPDLIESSWLNRNEEEVEDSVTSIELS